jgi:hypothetical protein
MRPVYKFLNIDNHQIIGDQMYNFVVNHTDILRPKIPRFFTDVNIAHVLTHAPLLKEFLDVRYLTPTKMSVIVVPADIEPYLHVDTVDPFVRILWPVQNCAGSQTKFYDVPREYLELTSYLDGVFFYDIIEQRKWQKVGEFELTTPLVFDASVAHEVHPSPDATGHRISFTIGFDRDLPISKSVKAWFGFQR